VQRRSQRKGKDDVPAQRVAAVDELPPDQSVSETVIELAGWVVASKDNQGYPFAVMDKAAAQVLIFGGDGKLRGAAPALFGSAIGDHSAPGVAKLALSAIPGHDRTTPAGRFIGGYGPSDDAGRVLWVDYDSAVSMHPLPPGSPKEKRAERLASPTPDDNRVTHGCINVSPAFYEQIVQSTFEKGGVFYILPDKDSIAKTFPEFAQSRGDAKDADEKRAAREQVAVASRAALVGSGLQRLLTCAAGRGCPAVPDGLHWAAPHADIPRGAANGRRRHGTPYHSRKSFRS
jgi:hypothetical protein